MGLTMATLTKKDLLEAIEDMPVDAEICVRDFDYEEEWNRSLKREDIVYDKDENAIIFW